MSTVCMHLFISAGRHNASTIKFLCRIPIYATITLSCNVRKNSIKSGRIWYRDVSYHCNSYPRPCRDRHETLTPPHPFLCARCLYLFSFLVKSFIGLHLYRDGRHATRWCPSSRYESTLFSVIGVTSWCCGRKEEFHTQHCEGGCIEVIDAWRWPVVFGSGRWVGWMEGALVLGKRPEDIHVLLVDDERVSRLVVGNLLRKCNYQGQSLSSSFTLLSLSFFKIYASQPDGSLTSVLANSSYTVSQSLDFSQRPNLTQWIDRSYTLLPILFKVCNCVFSAWRLPL